MTTAPTHPPASGARVAVVDAERLNRSALEDFLRAAGFAVIEFTASGIPSLQQLRDDLPELVLLDLPPGTAGAAPSALLQAMQQDRRLREVPVIVLTSHADLSQRLTALQCGAADFLVTPIDPRELALRLRNTLAAKALGDRLARTDALTGLPNRDATLHRLDWAVKHARRQGSVGAGLQVGLERCKQVNDALGPSVGDELLRAVALRLQVGLRDTDMVSPAVLPVTLPAALEPPTPPTAAADGTPVLSRAGGAEFTVLLPVIERADDAAVVAERVALHMTQPFDIGGRELYVSCRIGISVFPDDSSDADMVLKHAGAAMRQGKRPLAPGDAAFHFHSCELNARSLNRLTVEQELHHALERGELRLHYQPKVDIASGRLCGAEALVRWQHPQRGLLGPGEFIGVAEDCGLIAPLGDWVLREALRQLAAWRRLGWALPQIAINVASQQLQRPGLVAGVRAALACSGIDATSLCLELTESAIIDSGPHTTRRLHELKALGLQIALDDFGTGYSSLSYLHKFPLDEIKIDRSFLAHCGGGDRHGEAITKAIIAMGHGLGLRVVAEGVETQRQLDFIRAQQCDVFQGFLFAQPLPAEECADLFCANSVAELV